MGPCGDRDPPTHQKGSLSLGFRPVTPVSGRSTLEWLSGALIKKRRQSAIFSPKAVSLREEDRFEKM
jgi:hypothetical protein